MPYIVEVNDVTKKFKRTKALSNVSMKIKKGDIYGFVGENGAGKSTLIRVITNIASPTSGDVTLNVEKRLGSVAALVETPALYASYTAMGNLEAHAALIGVSKTKNELVEYLVKVGLADQVDTRKIAKNFSLGMKQRLSIAMLLLSDPEFVLLDEPMNGLDPVGIKDMRDLILSLNKEQGTTFLISSHILSELDKVATTYGFISRGVLLEEISASDLHKKARSYGRIELLSPLDKKAETLLKGVNYEVRGEKTLIIDGEEEALKALQHLAKNDVLVAHYEIIKESIEDYYLKVIRSEEVA